MRYFAFAFIAILLANCGDGSLSATNPSATRNIVVLSKDPVFLGESAKVFRGDQPMRVVGEQAMVCLVLRGDVSDKESDALFKQLMNEAQVEISVTLTSGEAIQLSEPLPGWSRSGTILRSGELVGCASDCCEGRLPKGSEIKEATIKSSKPLAVQGIYWKSTDAYDGLGKK